MVLCGSLCCVETLVAIFIVYKLIDRLLRWPRIDQYSDRYIVLTGCDTGFGHSAARRLDRLGCHVFAGCLTEAGQNELIRHCSSRLKVFHLDVTSHDSVLRGYDFVKSKLPSGKGWRYTVVVRMTAGNLN
jgi:NAD(P)-dependent dehydrogenase (short-subunit alcohol dehydrogenase family)